MMEIANIYKEFQKGRKVSTDSRDIEKGSLFFALRGSNHNGNDYAIEALNKGASLAIVDDGQPSGGQFIKVNDTLETLQQLAAYHRAQFKIPVLAMTGSNGKTTTKELIHAILSKKFITCSTPNNLNNHIGVPLTLLNITQKTEVAVIEMGANHIGEISKLCDIANPTHGVITNIGKAHVGTFGGIQNIIKGKSELHRHLLKNDGVVFINSMDPIISKMAQRFRNPIMYPGKSDYMHCELVNIDPFISYRSENGDMVKTQLIGRYNFENIATALTIGKFFGVPESKANDAVAAYKPNNMRSQVIHKDHHTILLDAYNANPSSMEAAIQNLSNMVAPHKIAILGDMYELGDDAQREHSRIGQLLQKEQFNEIFLCGQLSKEMKESLPEAYHFDTPQKLKEALENMHLPPSTILIKASRGMQLETIVDAIQ